MPGNGNWKREWLIAGLTIFCALIGWMLLDRIKLEKKYGEITQHTEQLKRIEIKLDSLPPHTISREEHEALVRMIENQHTENLAEMQHIEGRIDRLTIGLGRSGLSPDPPVRIERRLGEYR